VRSRLFGKRGQGLLKAGLRLALRVVLGFDFLHAE
jgi:hypothetical protein